MQKGEREKERNIEVKGGISLHFEGNGETGVILLSGGCVGELSD